MALLRYNADGTPDTSFGGGDGVVFTDPPRDFGADSETGAGGYGPLLEPGGRIVVTGGLYNYFSSQFSLFAARYNPNGALDHSLGSGGVTTTDSAQTGALTSVVLQPDGKIVAVGGTGSNTNEFAVFRYEGGGGPIPTYHRLTISKTGQGSGHSFCGQVSAGSQCSGDFEAGDTATLQASPDNGSTFVGWSGGGCSGAADCQVTMSGDTQVTATFTLSGSGRGTGGGGSDGGGNPSPTPTPTNQSFIRNF